MLRTTQICGGEPGVVGAARWARLQAAAGVVSRVGVFSRVPRLSEATGSAVHGAASRRGAAEDGAAP